MDIYNFEGLVTVIIQSKRMISTIMHQRQIYIINEQWNRSDELAFRKVYEAYLTRLNCAELSLQACLYMNEDQENEPLRSNR